tara:strand:+ start:126 stop:605 length:480 start_codon:yes stop_codon:yes gene_type:complete
MGIHDADPNTPNKEFGPEGWHVPSDDEWTTLEEHLIANGYNYDGSSYNCNPCSYDQNKIAKAMASTTGWSSTTIPGEVGNDQSLNNSSGFNALPVGIRSSFPESQSYNESFQISFWSSTEYNNDKAWYRKLGYTSESLDRQGPSGNDKRFGFSVRFVRD